MAVWLDLDIACILNASPVCKDWEEEVQLLEPGASGLLEGGHSWRLEISRDLELSPGR